VTTELSQDERDRLIALDPSLDPEAQRALTIREYPGFGASDLDRREHDAVDDAQQLVNAYIDSPRSHMLPAGDIVLDLAMAVAVVMTEDEVAMWLNSRNEEGDRLAAAQNCLADMIFGNRFMKRNLGSATLDLDGKLTDLYSPVIEQHGEFRYVPQVYFIEVSPTGLLARAGFRPQHPDGSPKLAFATMFTAADHYVSRKSGKPQLSFYRTDKGDPKWSLPSQYWMSVTAATEARDALRDAVHTLRRNRRTAHVPDTPHDERPSPTIGA
jgi:hypothetical protein